MLLIFNRILQGQCVFFTTHTSAAKGPLFFILCKRQQSLRLMKGMMGGVEVCVCVCGGGGGGGREQINTAHTGIPRHILSIPIQCLNHLARPPPTPHLFQHKVTGWCKWCWGKSPQVLIITKYRVLMETRSHLHLVYGQESVLLD